MIVIIAFYLKSCACLEQGKKGEGNTRIHLYSRVVEHKEVSKTRK